MKKLTARQVLKIVKSTQWFIQGFNGFPLYLHCVASNTGWMGKQAVGANYSHFFYRVHESELHVYYDEQDLYTIGEAYYKNIHDIRELGALRKKHKDQYLFFRKKTGNLPAEQLHNLSLEQIITLARRHADELTMTINLSHVIEGISWISERRLNTFLENYATKNNKDAQLFSSPVDPSFILRSQMLLWKIKKSSGTRRKKIIEKFIKHFGWLDTSFVKGKTLDAYDVWLKAKELKRQPSLQGLVMTKRIKSARIKELALNREEIFVVKTIASCTIWQDNRKEYILQSIARFEPVIRELSRRLGISSDAFKYICPKELTQKNLSSKKFVEELKKRYPYCGYYVLRNQIVAYAGKEYMDIEKELPQKSDKNVRRLNGTIANMGSVVGTVRICRTIHDIPKVKRGEILVAFMTRPEFLPAMEKAAAFVTNEGGITCHAAIVSREMDKPCIIGTKIATEVLRDGDIVEVNANHGVVTVVKRA